MLSGLIKKAKDLLNLPLIIGQLKEQKDFSLKNPKVLIGRMLANINNINFKTINKLSEVEFQVYSQWGDDGIIQWLINQVDIENKTFIEFGVQDYTESNTRFLLVNNNWVGLVIDGSQENIKFIKADNICNLHHLHAKCSFITAENINSLIENRPFKDDVGILSIDIDGNDYWIWKAISAIKPPIVICEYNAVFKLNTWTIPYKSDFTREFGNAKTVIYGSSLQSLCDLSDEKGYYFVGCNSAGNNAYFIRKDKIGSIKPLTALEGYEFAKFREAKGTEGEWISEENRFNILNNSEIFNTKTKEIETIRIGL